MTQYLIDNSVLHGFADENDYHHAVCKKFFEENKNNELFFTIHSLFEFQASKSRKNDFVGLPGTYIFKNKKFFDIDRKLYDYCQNHKLFEKFPKLRGGDLIYACIAYLGNYTLVTCDNDFNG